MTRLSDIENVFEKIFDAAQDGKNGSEAYRLGRLTLIMELADAGLKKCARYDNENWNPE